MPEQVVIEVYRVHNAFSVTIMQENEGSGHGYRICGPKLGGAGERVGRHVLDERDAKAIRGYLDRVLMDTAAYDAGFDAGTRALGPESS